ncbi:hypothetical protein [Chrysiogenes arsenatis]|uniref:hypothetical protein n=1 Tax=Chrysiogenes arsenatis TaxID=309797 RepID=UPI0004022B19|nr:hypothetical protein [Chrysiogenes arsenatis]
MIYSYKKTITPGHSGTVYDFRSHDIEGVKLLREIDGRHYVYIPDSISDIPEQLPEIEFQADTQADISLLLAHNPEIISRIREEGERRLAAIAQPYEQGERESWFVQLEEAKSGGGAMLESMAQARGVSLELMIEKVLENNQLYRAAVGHILGQQQGIIDRVNAGELSAWWE